MTKLPKPLMIILGVLVIILLFDVMVLIKNGFSITALGGMIVVLGTGLYLLRDFGKDVQKQRDAEEAQRRLEAAEEEAEEDEYADDDADDVEEIENDDAEEDEDVEEEIEADLEEVTEEAEEEAVETVEAVEETEAEAENE